MTEVHYPLKRRHSCEELLATDTPIKPGLMKVCPGCGRICIVENEHWSDNGISAILVPAHWRWATWRERRHYRRVTATSTKPNRRFGADVLEKGGLQPRNPPPPPVAQDTPPQPPPGAGGT